MRTSSTILLPMLCVLLLSSTAQAQSWRSSGSYNETLRRGQADMTRLSKAVCLATNDIRARQGLKRLPLHSLLDDASQGHAEQMLRRNFFSHQDPSLAHLRTPTDRGRAAGIQNPSIAENIAARSLGRGDTYKSMADALLRQWMNSPGHRKNILSPKALQLGCGVALKARAGAPGFDVYAVQNFQWFKPVRSGHIARKPDRDPPRTTKPKVRKPAPRPRIAERDPAPVEREIEDTPARGEDVVVEETVVLREGCDGEQVEIVERRVYRPSRADRSTRKLRERRRRERIRERIERKRRAERRRRARMQRHHAI